MGETIIIVLAILVLFVVMLNAAKDYWYLGKRGIYIRKHRSVFAGGQGMIYRICFSDKLLKVSSESWLKREVEILQTINRAKVRGVVTLYDFGENWYIMENLGDTHTLRDIMEKERYFVFQKIQKMEEVTWILSTLHGQGIVHCDLSPGNVYIKDDHVKIADFGASYTRGSQFDSRYLGPPPSTLFYTSRVIPRDRGRFDVYSVGKILDEWMGRSLSTKNHSYLVEELPDFLADRLIEIYEKAVNEDLQEYKKDPPYYLDATLIHVDFRNWLESYRKNEANSISQEVNDDLMRASLSMLKEKEKIDLLPLGKWGEGLPGNRYLCFDSANFRFVCDKVCGKFSEVQFPEVPFARFQPYFPGISLKNGWQKLCAWDVESKVRLLARILQELVDIHKDGQAHGNLSPDNILVDILGDRKTKIIDRGEEDSGPGHEQPPEIVRDQEGFSQTGVDIWRLGTIAYKLLNEVPHDTSFYRCLEDIGKKPKGAFQPLLDVSGDDFPKAVEKEIRDILARSLAQTNERRPSANEMLEVFLKCFRKEIALWVRQSLGIVDFSITCAHCGKKEGEAARGGIEFLLYGEDRFHLQPWCEACVKEHHNPDAYPFLSSLVDQSKEVEYIASLLDENEAMGIKFYLERWEAAWYSSILYLKPDDMTMENWKNNLVQRIHRGHKILNDSPSHSFLSFKEVQFQKPKENERFVVLRFEYFSGVSLRQLMDYGRSQGTSISDRCKFKILYELACALNVLHGQSIVHRNVSPKSVLVGVDGRVKLGDFSLCKFDPDAPEQEDFPNVTMELARGKGKNISNAYTSPESFNAMGQATVKSDIWSWGALAYELSIGSCPFAPSFLQEVGRIARPRAEDVVEETRKRFASVPIDYASIKDERIRECIRKSLSLDPSQRPDAGEIVSCLEEVCFG